MKKVRCPHCLKEFTDLEEQEMRDYITPLQYKQRLVSRKQEIMSANKWLNNVRGVLQRDSKHNTPIFNLLIAVETLTNHLRSDLNRELEREGVSRIARNKGSYSTHESNPKGGDNY